jgi:cell division protein FtsB
VVIAAVFIPPFAKYQELRSKSKGLETRIKELKAEEKRLLAEKARLETDITYVEKKARERLGIVRKGEIVLKEQAKRR